MMIKAIFLGLISILSANHRLFAHASMDSSSTRKLFLATNWKCSIESPEEADQLVKSMNQKWANLDPAIQDSVELSVHPPYAFLDRVRQGMVDDIAVGSQNVYDASFPNKGNTAATTPKMLAGLGCQWVLLGHSDRRNNLGETDELIAEKAAKCLEQGLGIVLTIGETKEQRDKDETLVVLEKQLGTVAKKVPSDDAWHRIVLAYEPVWAVGEGATPCAPDEAQRIHTALRNYLAQTISPAAAQACRITYTGSVNPGNAQGYSNLSQVDGFVVGRAGLDADQLTSIIQTLVETKKNSKTNDEL
mmetsp:Transcript_20282/g.30500  ORF Transcript_20282/g.30500 Transcript_20282/m.30500 type:complete len:303 (-) Transcript_20282:17-925(-)